MASPPRTGQLPCADPVSKLNSVAGIFLFLVFSSLVASAILFVFFSRHWPLVGDSAQIHYICFLMDHGMAPYRVTGDMNMPGALLLEWLVMHGLGAGSLAWRCFDLMLLALITTAMTVVAGEGNRSAGVAAGCFFAVVHGVDGLNDTGERDLSIAALILLSYAFLFSLLRGPQSSQTRVWKVFAFAFCASAAALIKPTVLPLTLVLFTVFTGLLSRLPPPYRSVHVLSALASATAVRPGRMTANYISGAMKSSGSSAGSKPTAACLPASINSTRFISASYASH